MMFKQNAHGGVRDIFQRMSDIVRVLIHQCSYFVADIGKCLSFVVSASLVMGYYVNKNCASGTLEKVSKLIHQIIR